MKKIALITGGTGFIGSRIVPSLLSKGFEVRIISYSKLTSDLNNFSNDLKWYSPSGINDAVKGVTEFYNFAVVYDRNDVNSEIIKEINIDLPLNIMERLKRNQEVITCVMGDSFFSKYPSSYTVQNRYTESKKKLKACVASRLEKEKNLRCGFLQIEHVYGEGDSFAKVIPAIAKKIIENVDYINLTSGKQERDFIYVDDVVLAALTICRSNTWHGIETIECGTGRTTTMRELFESIKKIAKSKSELRFGAMNDDQKINSSVANNAWLQNNGWKANTSLDDGLERLVSEIRCRLLLK